MLTWIREKFGTVLISVIIGLIALVFVFFGIFSPKNTRGLHEGSVAGTVNSEPITLAEFNQQYNRRLEMFRNMGGGKISEEQLKAFHIKEGIFQELVRRKLMVQEAERQGLVPSEEEIREKVSEIPAFQKDGKFDFDTYKQTLAANQYTPGGFERMVREDLSAARWEDYFKERVHFSEAELKQAFLESHDKRNIKYVLITNEAAKKGVEVPAADIQKYLADPQKTNLLKARYDGRKGTEYKGKTFEQVKAEIARELLAGEKIDQVQKMASKLADEVVAILGSEKSSDTKVNALLKPYGVEVKSTGLISRPENALPGLGEQKALIADSFSKKSPIDAKNGGKAKKYTSPQGVVVALLVESELPDLAKLESDRDSLIHQVTSRKERELMDDWMKGLSKKAKIDPNPSVIGDQEAG